MRADERGYVGRNRRDPLKTWQEKQKNGCAMQARGACYGGIDSHHIIPKVRLKLSLGRERGIEAAQDDRNLCALCRYHHHRVTVRALRLREDEVPDRAWEFAADYGLGWSLDKDIEKECTCEHPDPGHVCDLHDAEESWESQDQLKERLQHGS
jgi:hypothetical protein